MAVIVEDTIEIVVSNPLLRNNVSIVNPSIKNTVTVSQGYTVAAGSGVGSGGGTVTQITAINGLTGGVITGSGSIGLADTDVSPGSYTSANITVDSKGRITYATNGSGSGGADTSIDSDLYITNTDAAFAHMTSPISSGTSVQDILIEMLQKYVVTTIGLTQLKVSLQAANGTWGEAQSMSSVPVREIGGGVRVSGFTFSIADTSQIEDNSVSFAENNTLVQGGFNEDFSIADLSSYQEVSPATPQSFIYKASAVDNGDGVDVVISDTMDVRFRYRAKVGTTTTSVINSGNASTVYNNIEPIVDSLMLESNIQFNGNANTNNEAKHTCIIYPNAWGDISSILQSGYEVVSDFNSFGPFSLPNANGAVLEYKFYVSIDPGAFADGVPLTVSF